MSTAWKQAKKNIKTAQKCQKSLYDRKARPPKFLTCDRVFLYKPAEKSGEGRKLARPCHGPYWVTEMNANNAQIRRVDQPEQDLLLVATDRLRRCPDEVEDTFWPSDPWPRNTDVLALLATPPINFVTNWGPPACNLCMHMRTAYRYTCNII